MNILATFVALLTFFMWQSNQSTTYRNYIPSWSPDGKKLLFYSDRNGQWDIFLINDTGAELKQITYSKANETEPCWHPDGTFAYVSNEDGERKIYQRDFTAAAPKLLTPEPGNHSSPAWSPDGTHLAYLRNIGDETELVVKETSNLMSSAVLYKGKTYPGRPTWSPDGKSVLYSVAVGKTETLHYVDHTGRVIRTFIPGYNSCGNATLSPDGTMLLFDAHQLDSLDSGDGKWEIYVMSTSSGHATRLTSNDKDDWGGRWSPDGSRIAFLGNGFNNTGYELFIMNKDGSGRQQLTDRKK